MYDGISADDFLQFAKQIAGKILVIGQHCLKGGLKVKIGD